MPERLKIALVGCGGMGRRHLRGIAALYQSSFSNVELVAVCDLNQDNARFLADEAAELLGSRPRVYADIATMAREIPDLQAASDSPNKPSLLSASRILLARLPTQIASRYVEARARRVTTIRWATRQRPHGKDR